MRPAYRLSRPSVSVPLVYDSPHSGTHYPDDFRTVCSPLALMTGEDRHVDELYADAPQHGAVLLCAEFPRTYIDVNRAVTEIDPLLLDAPWPGEMEETPRSRAGIGLVRRLLTPTTPMYDRPLSVTEIQTRIQHYYMPYHTALKNILDETYSAHGRVYHLNCHSMPSTNHFAGYLGRHTDFVLGDRDGTTSDIHFVHALRSFLEDMGYSVAINDPYKGVELVRRYACPALNRHSVQIEICRSLYMNEDTGEKNKGFPGLKENINRLMRFCTDYVTSERIPLAAD